MLQYALLHLAGYDLTIDDLKNFRQLHSKTPGHPEIGVTSGVETSTGPLGQGIANAVGMALAEKMLAAEFNEEGYDIINNYTYAFLGDGCLMEGISHEVCSLAGVWKLNKLIALYDDNGISIDGKIENWFGENVRERFESYNWNVIGPIDGHDIEAVSEAIEEAKKSDKPTLIDCKTVIGFGSPNRAGTTKRTVLLWETKSLLKLRKLWAGNTLPLKFLRKFTKHSTLVRPVPKWKRHGLKNIAVMQKPSRLKRLN